MSRWINVDKQFIPYVAAALDVSFSADAQVVAEFEGTQPVAAVIYDGYNGRSVHVHIWIAPGERPSKHFWWSVYDCCWRHLDVENAVGTVPASNKKAQKLDKHLGFVHKGTIPNYYMDGDDMMIFVATRDTIPDWQRWHPVKDTVEA